MSRKIQVDVHLMPARITIDMDHETYEEFAETCRLLDPSKEPADHIKEMIENRLDMYERARASAHETVHAQMETEGLRDPHQMEESYG